jgi:hypothetical protein
MSLFVNNGFLVNLILHPPPPLHFRNIMYRKVRASGASLIYVVLLWVAVGQP